MTCMAGGDAVALHDSLRDHVYMAAVSAGMHVEREESGLLPEDPRRRPGDLCFSLWPGGAKVAMDFAVTSPLQMGNVAAAAGRQLAVAEEYEQRKRSDRGTAERCRGQGYAFLPMIAESFGGWGPEAQKALGVIAHARALRHGVSQGKAVSELYEGLSTKIMRASARSLLGRLSLTGPGEGPSAVRRARTALAAAHAAQ